MNSMLMKRACRIGLTVSMLAGCAMSSVSFAADPEVGKQKANTCLGCHGVPDSVNVYPTYHVPKIGGQHEEYLIAALNAYKGKTRSHVTMHANAASLSDEDMADIAAYFASLGAESSVAAEATTDSEPLAAACAACHGADGNSTLAANPKLAGQYESYLVRALSDYRSGDRESAIMAGFASALSDQDIRTLAAWFASQESDLKVLD